MINFAFLKTFATNIQILCFEYFLFSSAKQAFSECIVFFSCYPIGQLCLKGPCCSSRTLSRRKKANLISQ